MRFDTVFWPELNAEVTFIPDSVPLASTGAGTVVAFAWNGSGFLLANISGRGWCTPSGHLEPGESIFEAAVRETREETGAVLTAPEYLGSYIIERPAQMVETVPAVLGVVKEYSAVHAHAESLATRLVSLDNIPRLYYRWDSLLEAVFQFAAAVASGSGADNLTA